MLGLRTSWSLMIVEIRTLAEFLASPLLENIHLILSYTTEYQGRKVNGKGLKKKLKWRNHDLDLYWKVTNLIKSKPLQKTVERIRRQNRLNDILLIDGNTHIHTQTHGNTHTRTYTHAAQTHTHTQTHRKTDRQTDRETDRQTKLLSKCNPFTISRRCKNHC